MAQPSISMPLGIVVRKSPGVTKWARWIWRAVAVLPGAQPATWKELRRDGEAVEYHATTVDLELWRKETEAYLSELHTQTPSIYIVLRDASDTVDDQDVEIVLATASPFEAQDYADSGEEMVEQVPMPAGVRAWIEDFIARHHHEEKFIKRKRDKKRVDLVEDGVGDARIPQLTDVYRAPRRRKPEVLQ